MCVIAYSRCVYACEYVVTNTSIRGRSKSYNYYTLTLTGFNMKLRGRLNFFFLRKVCTNNNKNWNYRMDKHNFFTSKKTRSLEMLCGHDHCTTKYAD